MTAALFAALAPLDVQVVDVEQLVVHERLVLAVLVETCQPDAVGQAARGAAREAGLQAHVERHGPVSDHVRRGRHHVTVLSSALTPSAFASVAAATASSGANIERVERLARYPAQAYELLVAGGDAARLRAALASAAADAGVDVAVQRASLYRRAKRLVCLDVDSTLVQGEVVELLAEHAGAGPRVAAVTEAAMRGELDFEESLRERVALLAGLPASAVAHVREHLRLTPGARTLVRTLRRLGVAVGVVSGGFTCVTDHLAARLELDFAAANVLETDDDGALTGRLLGPVVDRAGKAEALARFAASAGVPLSSTVAVGDGANDLDMLAAAGLGVAFNAKPVVVEQARRSGGVALSVPYLDAVLFLLGIPREEVEEADADAADRAGLPLVPSTAGA